MRGMKKVLHFFQTPLFIFSILLNVKYFGLQIILFQNWNVWDSLKVSLPSILVFTILLELVLRARTDRRKLTAYMLLNCILSALMVSVIVYFRQFGIIVTYHALMQAHQVLDVSDSILDLLKPLYLLYFLDIAIILLLRLIRRRSPSWLSMKAWNRKALSTAWFGSAAVLILLGAIHSNILNELKQAERMGLISYEVHTLLTGIRSASAAGSVEPITPDAVRAVKNIQLVKDADGFGAAEGRNLIVIQLESFQNFLVGLELDGIEITPALNELLSESYYFSNIYQSIGQGDRKSVV